MDRKSILAIVLSVSIMLLWFVLFPTNKAAEAVLDAEQISAVEEAPSPPVQETIEEIESPVAKMVLSAEEDFEEVLTTIKTDYIEAIFTNKGGNLVSYKLLKHEDRGEPVDLITAWDDGPHAFSLSLGDGSDGLLDGQYSLEVLSDLSLKYSKAYSLQGKVGADQSVFVVSKCWEFKPAEYLFQLEVTIDGNNEIPVLSNTDFAYTVEFGPQLGPVLKATKNKGRYQDFRDVWLSSNGKPKKDKSKNLYRSSYERYSWTAIVGKYFMLSSIPDATQYVYTWDMRPQENGEAGSRFRISRPPLKSSKTTDTYKFYLGPKIAKDLTSYNLSTKNAWNLSGTNLDGVLTSVPILGQLEKILKWIMGIFYLIIPNYGVSIILLTVLVRALMFPMTKKGSESTLRMQELSPRIKELQEKYKDNPTKLNTEMAMLYKKEGYNPLSGCLPMLLQLPIFFAMYNLFNNHFDLRGAMFIPGWITDLSQPEYVWSFAPFRIPILGWSQLRLLPFLYLVSQLLYGKINQTTGQQSNNQMVMFMYVMPIMFFFILYDVPSGLLIYWIMSNTLSLFQQMAINKYLKARKEEMAKQNTQKNAILPPKKRKKK